MMMPVSTKANHVRVATEFGSISAQVSGSGSAVILWPSIFSTHELYKDFADALARDHLVISIDPPGHGGSALTSAEISLEDCVLGTFELLNHLNVDVTAWVGTSWGGLVGVLAAKHEPERIRHLTCLGTPFRFERKFSLKTIFVLTLCRLIGTSPLFANGVAEDFFLEETRQNAELMALHESVFTNANKGELFNAARLIFWKREDMFPHLTGVTVPGLVIAGTKDRHL